MHICMITGEFPPFCTGIGTYVYNLSKKLLERGYDVTIMTRGSIYRKCYSIELDNIDIWKIRYFPIYPFHVRFHGYFLNDILLKHEKKFDLIHIHSPLVPSLKTNLPIVVTEHGTVQGPISKSQNHDLSSILLKNVFFREFISLDYEVLRNSDIITTVSNSCMNEIKNMLPEKKEIYVIGNGVDTNFFLPNPSIIRDQKTILFAGRLDSGKGVSDLIFSAKEVCKNFPDSKFILAGKGPNRKYLESLIAKLKLNDNIFLMGHLSQEILLKLYQSSTIYVLPSYYEGLPTTLLEAMSCGLPSIATDIGGNSEVITDNLTGILVPPKCPEELSRNIMNLLESKKDCDRLGKSARKHVINNYDWNIIVNKIEKIYHLIS
jgi:L-malate glycosyltransferase